jgi:hypothetical protein
MLLLAFLLDVDVVHNYGYCGCCDVGGAIADIMEYIFTMPLIRWFIPLLQR